MENKIKIGDRYVTNDGLTVEVLDYFNSKEVRIKFIDSIEHTKFVEANNLRKGQVSYPYSKNVLSIGFHGIGRFEPTTKGKASKEYSAWMGVMNRCYNPTHLKRRPSYFGCKVHAKWHNFQNFANWFEENYREGYQLDKDIFIKGNKIYSPDTCCFVPQRINTLFIKSNSKRGFYPIGVNKHGKKFQSYCNNGEKQVFLGTFDTPEEAFEAYKIYKENLIVSIAKEYFEKDLISFDVYKALLLYKIEITD